ncbi:MAG: RNA polymerase sigma factor [Candidatus Cryptobacteroides sp.]
MGTGEFKRRWLPLSDRFYRVAFYILESREDALDAVQDLYVKLWKMGPALDPVLNPEAYGLALLKNMCMDRVRHSRVAAADPIDGGADVADGRSLESEYSGRETLRIVEEMIGRLPEKQRVVMRMRVFEGAEYEEIAARTGLSGLNLRVLLSMARKTLRKEMNRLNVEI